MIYAMLRGELPPRALMGIDERSSVADARRAAVEAFKAGPEAECLLSSDGAQLDDDRQELAHYGVQSDALIHAELVNDERRAKAPVRL
jgi:hypothetical protein